MSIRRLLEGMQLPLIPDVQSKDSMNKWVRDINEYLRRLSGVFTAVNILNTIVDEGTGDVTINNLVDFVDLQTSAFDSDDLIVYSELQTNSEAYKLYIDISAITGYSATEFQFLHHNDAGAASWLGIEDISGWSGSVQQVLTHNSSGDLVWVNTDTC